MESTAKDVKKVIRKNQRLINLFNILSDAVLIFAAYFAALAMRFEVLNGQESILPVHSGAYAAVALVYSGLLVVAYCGFRMYGSYRFKDPASEIITILLLNGIGVLILMALLYFTRIVDFSRLAIFFFWLFSSLFIIAKRTVVRAVLRYYRELGYNQKHVILVGSGHFAQQYLQDIQANPQMGFTVDGYVSGEARPGLGKRLGSYEELEEILEHSDPDELIVALDPQEIGYMRPVLAAADKEGVRISIIPFYNDYFPSHPTIDVVGRTRLVNMRATPLDNLGWAMAKRGMDIVGSLLLIVVTSPIMLGAAIGVKLSSPGPILFKQERVGKGKKVFKMWKFRSMRITGTEDTGWSTENDPRKTKFGSFIRKFSIDELPQFFNVLLGQMSLIGPRPEVPFHVNHFREEIPLYLVRQQVRPGITGWAQVHGLRGDTSIEARVKYDIWYIENWGLGLDLKILFRTMFGGMVNQEKLGSQKLGGTTYE